MGGTRFVEFKILLESCSFGCHKTNSRNIDEGLHQNMNHLHIKTGKQRIKWIGVEYMIAKYDTYIGLQVFHDNLDKGLTFI